MKKTIGISIAVVILLLIASVYGLHRYYFPYGFEHRCDKGLYFVLRDYAEKHNGNYPSGEATPEASLSLIHSLDDSGFENAYLLHRRDVPEEVVRQILKSEQLLDPQTCGYNYVEGLRLDSKPQLALFWDKEGLSEIGMRLSGGGHIVTFVDGGSRQIPESEWNSFVEEQQKLLAEEKIKVENHK
jgi:hypothetical protein